MAPAVDVDLVLTGGLCVTCDEAGTGTPAEPILDPAWSVVHRAGGSDVRHVVVDGSVVVEDREFVKLDIEALRRQAMDVIDGYFAEANIDRARIEL